MTASPGCKQCPLGRVWAHLRAIAMTGMAICAALPLSLHAQERIAPREAEWSRANSSEAEDLDPLERSWIRRFVAQVESRQHENELLEVYDVSPILGGLRSGAGTTAGLLFEPFEQGEPLYFSVGGRASVRGYWGTEGLFGLEAKPFVTYGYARYRHLPQEDFYGIGANTSKDAQSAFRQDELLVGGLAGFHPGGHLFVGGHVSFLENRVGSGDEPGVPRVMEAFDASEVPGFHPGVSYVAAGAWIEYDTRELPPLRAYGSRFSPSQERLQGLSLDARRGLNASVELRRYMDLDGGAYGFSRLMVESQQYLPIAKGRLVVALREYGSFAQADAGELIPFYMMQPLGGVRTLRGFDNFRFRDNNLMLLNAELRWHVLRPLQLAVFTDAGHVFNRFRDVSPDDLEVGCGAGARLLFGGRVFMRLEFAHSREGMTTYVKLGSFL